MYASETLFFHRLHHKRFLKVYENHVELFVFLSVFHL